jgi:plasmid stabilization system protein ParE
VLSDRDAIFIFTEADNPSAAVLVDERIVAAAGRLIDSPASGRAGRIAGTRELVINGTPYVAAYAVTQSAVPILRVLRAQEWPDISQQASLRTSCPGSTGRRSNSHQGGRRVSITFGRLYGDP